MAAVLAMTSSGHATSQTFIWQANSEPDIAGYRLYYTSSTDPTPLIADVGNVTRATIEGLTRGVVYQFYATCYTTFGLESDPSHTVEVLIPSDPNINNPPVALGQTVTVVSGELTTITLEAHDPEGARVSFNYGSFPTHGTVSAYPVLNGDRATITYQSRPDYTGTDEFMFFVNDGWNESAPGIVTIQVTTVNTAPIVDSGSDATVTLPGWITLRGKVTDEGLPGTHPEPLLAWSQLSGPPGAHIQSPQYSHTQVTFIETGTYVFRLEAFDGELTGHDEVVIQVEALSNPSSPDVPPYTLYLEAESGALDHPMNPGDDPEASSSRYIATDTATQGTATYTFDLPIDADVVVWCRVRTPSAAADSFSVSVDNDPFTTDIYDASEGEFSTDWKWTPLYGRGGIDRTEAYAYAVAPRVLTLAAGLHQLTFRGREAGTQLDALILTTDPTFDPVAAESATTPPVLLNLEPIADHGVGLRWSTIPGRRYQIAYRDSLDATPWMLLPDTFRASTTTLVTQHPLPPSAGQRFYRGMLLP